MIFTEMHGIVRLQFKNCSLLNNIRAVCLQHTKSYLNAVHHTPYTIHTKDNTVRSEHTLRWTEHTHRQYTIHRSKHNILRSDTLRWTEYTQHIHNTTHQREHHAHISVPHSTVFV